MTRKAIATLFIVFLQVTLIACASTAVFKSLDTDIKGELQILSGRLIKPSGDGPFPAVVLLHGCAGTWDLHSDWMNRLQRWGYVSLLVNSFKPRGEVNICSPGKGHTIQPSRRAKDAFGAKLYLESLPYVDPNRIAVMGWSHGGMATLEAVQINVPSSSPFQAAVAFYPRCTRMYILNSPLLVMIGEKDDWTPAHKCKLHIKPQDGWPRIVLKIYPGAYHAFDSPYDLSYYLGHRVGRNQSAALDSYERVRAFLDKYMMGN